MLGSRFSRLVHASLAGGSLVIGGCTSRAYDFGEADEGGDAESTGSTGIDSATVTITGPTSAGPATATTPTTDPTLDPTDPTGLPPEQPGPPQLIEAELLDGASLLLSFSEPLASTLSVDPRQFRLSAAFTPNGTYYYQYYTYYQEVGSWNGACYENCYEYCYDGSCQEYCWTYCQPGPPVRVATLSQPLDRPDLLLLTLDQAIGSGVCSQLQSFPAQWTSALFVHYTPEGSAPITDLSGELLADIAEHWALQPDRQWDYNQGTFPFMEPVLPIPCPF